MPIPRSATSRNTEKLPVYLPKIWNKERGKLREKMSKVDKNLSAKMLLRKNHRNSLRPKDLHIGDSIKVLSLNLKRNGQHAAGCKRQPVRSDGDPAFPGKHPGSGKTG